MSFIVCRSGYATLATLVIHMTEKPTQSLLLLTNWTWTRLKCALGILSMICMVLLNFFFLYSNPFSMRDSYVYIISYSISYVYVTKNMFLYVTVYVCSCNIFTNANRIWYSLYDYEYEYGHHHIILLYAKLKSQKQWFCVLTQKPQMQKKTY